MVRQRTRVSVTWPSAGFMVAHGIGTFLIWRTFGLKRMRAVRFKFGRFRYPGKIGRRLGIFQLVVYCSSFKPFQYRNYLRMLSEFNKRFDLYSQHRYGFLSSARLTMTQPNLFAQLMGGIQKVLSSGGMECDYSVFHPPFSNDYIIHLTTGLNKRGAKALVEVANRFYKMTYNNGALTDRVVGEGLREIAAAHLEGEGIATEGQDALAVFRAKYAGKIDKGDSGHIALDGT